MSTRRQVIVMLTVLLLVGGALVLRHVSEGPKSPDLEPLRVAAALAACPAGGGAGLPALTLPCLGGGPAVRLSAAAPRPVLVTIWATWCPPCVREVPLLQDFATRARGQVDVLGVLHEDLPGGALEFARQYGMHYPSVVDDDGRVLRAFGTGPPITVLLTADGRVVHVRRGEFTALSQVTELVRTTLGVSVPAA